MKYKTEINKKIVIGTYKELLEIIEKLNFIHLNKIEKCKE